MAIGLNGLNHIRRRRSRNQRFRPLPLSAHSNTFRCRRCSVINRRIGCVHPGQITNHRLILKNRLQDALAYFRLIRCVRRQKIFLGNDACDRCRDIVTVRPRATENRAEHPILACQIFHLPFHFQLGLALWDLKFSFETDFLRDIHKQVFHGGQSDCLKHVLSLLFCIWYIAAHANSPPLRYSFSLSTNALYSSPDNSSSFSVTSLTLINHASYGASLMYSGSSRSRSLISHTTPLTGE